MSDDPYAAPTANVADPAASGLVEAAIGTNAGYYLSYLDKAAGRRWAISWNWPAFFVASAWLLYRKLWLAWFLYAVALSVVSIALGVFFEGLMGETAAIAVQYAVTLPIYFVLTPMYANAVYARKLERLVAQAESQHPTEAERLEWLRKRGGTSMIWILLVVAPLVLGVAAAIFIPVLEAGA